MTTETGTVGCATFQTLTHDATICRPNGSDPAVECKAAFCNDSSSPYPNHTNCVVKVARWSDTNVLKPEGTCNPYPIGTDGKLAKVVGVRDWRECTWTYGVCASTRPREELINDCVDLSATTAVQQELFGERDRTVQITSVVLDSPDCPKANTVTTAAKAYDVTPGPLGSASGGGLTVPLRASRGFAVIDQSCDGEVCSDQLKKLRVSMDDTTVAGVPLTNLVVTTNAPVLVSQVPAAGGGTTTGFAAGALRLFVRGKFNGVESYYGVSNRAPWTFDRTASALSLAGTLDVDDRDATGRQLPVSVSISLAGTPSSATSTACALASYDDRVLGFEDDQDWMTPTAGAALSRVTSPLTQGCGALGVTGQGFITVASKVVTTVGMTVKPAASVDLFIPTNQPNLFYIGALQMFLTCPSAGVNNQYIGQVTLTGKPLGAFSTLRFPLSSQIQSTLRRSLSDCSFGFGLNVNQTGRKWILDNLRFTP